MKDALGHYRKHLGDNVTILYDNLPDFIECLVKDHGKEAGGPWDCDDAGNFYGWEAERVVAVTSGYRIMELITRACTHLAVIFVDYDDDYTKNNNKNHFHEAVKKGLVDLCIV